MTKQFALIFAALVIAVSLSVTRAPPSASSPPAAVDSPGSVKPTVASTEPPQMDRDVVVLPRAPDGHFYTDAVVNGTTIRFLVDTGASTVALTRADAQQAGMFYAENDFNQVGRGAGGDVPLRSVTLGRVAVGNIEVHDVRGVVIGGSRSDISLLGQSFLSTLGSVTIEGDKMVLRPA
jgi:aspartyl protease family protein